MTARESVHVGSKLETLTGESLSISVGLDRGFRGLLVETFESI